MTKVDSSKNIDSNRPKIGDYVLATKYDDGDIGDHSFVGFVTGFTDHGRYLIADSEGINQRASGIRRAEKITPEEGLALVKMMPDLSPFSGVSMWDHLAMLRGEYNEGSFDNPITVYPAGSFDKPFKTHRVDPVAQTLTKLTAQRDEYRQHMERYQSEVAELKSENAELVKESDTLKQRIELLKAALKGQQEITNQAQDVARNITSELNRVKRNRVSDRKGP